MVNTVANRVSHEHVPHIWNSHDRSSSKASTIITLVMLSHHGIEHSVDCANWFLKKACGTKPELAEAPPRKERCQHDCLSFSAEVQGNVPLSQVFGSIVTYVNLTSPDHLCLNTLEQIVPTHKWI